MSLVNTETPRPAERGSSSPSPVGDGTPGEYVGEAESRESPLLAHITQRLVTPRPDCQVWTGATDRGYGRIYVDGTAKRVHRVIWELVNGPIPEGLTIDHLCRVRACCNTEHMEVVTHEENLRRAAPHRPSGASRRTNPLRTHCKNGHEYTPENTRIRRDGGRRCRTCDRVGKQQKRPAATTAPAA